MMAGYELWPPGERSATFTAWSPTHNRWRSCLCRSGIFNLCEEYQNGTVTEASGG